MELDAATKRRSDAATKGKAPSYRPPAAGPFSSLRRSVAPSLRRFPRAFTLVELIISVALVLVIMLGVNFVFKMAGDTVNAGQSLNESVRGTRAAQATLFDDFSRYAPDGPSLLLRSRSQVAFRNRQDELSDTDYRESGSFAERTSAKATIIDLDGDGLFNSPGERALITSPGRRVSRVDVVSFFARGTFRRQTGGQVGINPSNSPGIDPTAPLVSSRGSSEAWIWYGHLAIPDNNGTFTINTPGENGGTSKSNPGVGLFSTNPNNFYASNWILGRFAAVLVEPGDHDRNPATPNRIGDPSEVFIGRNPTAPVDSRSPLTQQSSAYYQEADGSTVQFPAGGGIIAFRDSRFDLVGTSISGYRQILSNAINALGLNTDWWSEMMLGPRFETNPFIVRPITARSIAQQAPIFLPGCTQFIVEYAGDFLSQDNDPTSSNFGDVVGVFFPPGQNRVTQPTDGEIDYIVVNGVKQIRWYGLPRDSSGDTIAQGYTSGPQGNRNNRLIDVVPLRDLIQTAPGYSGQQAFFEKSTPMLPSGSGNYANSMDLDDDYTCAWGPNDTVRPRMIRITMVVDDPTGRLAEGQTVEFVFTLPAAD
jgi:prepilin-type N-terminal cleavage/methylation domain-containing protein